MQSELCERVYQILYSKLSVNSFKEDWTDSGMIRKLHITGKLILKVLEVGVIYYKLLFITLNCYAMHAVLQYTGHRGISLHPLKPRLLHNLIWCFFHLNSSCCSKVFCSQGCWLNAKTKRKS